MAERTPSVRLTRGDYIFRALSVLSVLLYALVVYDNIVHSFTSISSYSLPWHYFNIFVATPFLLLVSGLIVWRALGNSVGRYLLLLTIGVFGWEFSYQVGSPQLASFLATAFLIYWSGLAFPSLFYLMLSFPTGRIFPPSWARWVVAFAIVKFLGVVLEIMAVPPSDPFMGPLLDKYGRLFLVPSLVPLQPLISITIGSNGVLFLIGLIAGIFSIVLRYRSSKPIERQQIKWVAWSFGILALTIPAVVAIALIPSFAAVASEGAIGSFVIGLLIVIVSIGISVLRYRLFAIDLIINRTVVYVPLTAILAGIFAASIVLSQKVFVALTGQQSDAATVLTTLIVVAVFEPLKKLLQDRVDKRFRTTQDPATLLKPFSDLMEARVFVIDPNMLASRLLDEAMKAFESESGAVFLNRAGHAQLLKRRGNSSDGYILCVPLESSGKQLGELSLGARRNGLDYTEKERGLLKQIAGTVALAVEAD